MDDGPEQLVILFVLLLLSAFFSSSETALTSISKIKLMNMVENEVKGAKNIQKVLENPGKLLSAILIGNNLVNIGASAMATSIAISMAGNNNVAVGIATGIITVLILIFSEITPKTFTSQNAEKVSLFVIRPIAFIVWLFTPLVFVFNFVSSIILRVLGVKTNAKTPLITEAELKTMVTVSHTEGVIEREEKTMIDNVVDFGDHNAEDIMIPRIQILAVSVDATLDEVIDTFMKEHYSRMPVYKENLDNIVGIIHLKDIFLLNNNGKDKEAFRMKDYMREPYFTYESKPLSKLFITMRTKRIPIAIVLDEYGGTSGLITLEDLIEEIVGDIDDEYDEENFEIQKISDTEYTVLGQAKIEDVNEMADADFKSENYDSIGGYVMGVLGHIPSQGESFIDKGFKFIVEDVDKNRVKRIHLYKLN